MLSINSLYHKYLSHIPNMLICCTVSTIYNIPILWFAYFGNNGFISYWNISSKAVLSNNELNCPCELQIVTKQHLTRFICAPRILPFIWMIPTMLIKNTWCRNTHIDNVLNHIMFTKQCAKLKVGYIELNSISHNEL